MCLANSLALKLAGVTRDTPDPPGGTIVRDAQGEPSGVLKDAAMNYVYKVIPDPSPEEMVEAIKAAMRCRRKWCDQCAGYVGFASGLCGLSKVVAER